MATTRSKDSNVRTNRPKAAAPSAPPVPRQPHALGNALPPKSLHRAAKALEGFSLSRFTADSRPENYLPTQRANDPAAVRTLQRKMITRQIKARPQVDRLNPGMTLALSQAQLKQLMPSFKPESGTVNLTDLLTVLRQRMNGTEFYATGAPPLIQSAEQSRLQSKVTDIFRSIKREVTR